MTILKKKQNVTATLLVDRKACEMARKSWLAAILAQYVLPRPSIWIVAMTLVVSAAAATVVCGNFVSTDPGETVVTYSYSVSLSAPQVALPVAPQAPDPAAAQPVPEPARPEPVIKQPEPVPAPVAIEPIAATAMPVAVAVLEAPLTPVISNSVAEARTLAPSAAPEQTAGASEGLAMARTTEVMAVTGEKVGQVVAKGNDSGGHALPAYWMSVRDAVAKKLVYPHRARSRGAEGLIVINLTLDNMGQVIKAEPLTSVIDEDLKNAAVKGVMRASPFKVPQLALGEKTITAQVPIQFKLVDQATFPN